MGHKLTCSQALLTCFKILQSLILILYYNLVTYSGDLTLNKFDLGYKFECVMCFVSVIVIRVHYDILRQLHSSVLSRNNTMR